MTYKGIYNQYNLSALLGQGGEGKVYCIENFPQAVAKIYNQPVSSDKASKLRFMLAKPPGKALSYAAWPEDLLQNAEGDLVGFTMKRLDNYAPIHYLYNPMDRKQHFPNRGYDFLIHVARNLATAFQMLHAANLIIGDINESNILVNQQGMVAFIDCDSFQMIDHEYRFLCEVGVPRYTAPEILLSASFQGFVRTQNTDSFSLAVLVFQLLFLGRHPFAGRNISKEDIDEEKAIRCFDFAYSIRRTNKRLLPPPDTLSIERLSAGLIDNFHRAFESAGERPAPLEWVNALSEYQKTIVKCDKYRTHLYSDKYKTCPWCEFQQKGPVFFIEDVNSIEVPSLNDITTFVNGYVIDAIPTDVLPKQLRVGEPRMVQDFGHSRIHYRATLIIYFIVIVSTTIAAFSNFVYILVGLLGLYMNYYSPMSKSVRSLKHSLRNKVALIQRDLDTAIEGYNNHANIKIFNSALGEFERQKKNCILLTTEWQLRKKVIEENSYNESLDKFLDRFKISDYQIKNFGPQRKNLLATHNILTAKDISRLDGKYTPGIAYTYGNTLYAWQRSMKSGFVYRPDLGSINRKILFVSQEIVSKISLQKSTIISRYNLLHQQRMQIVAGRDKHKLAAIQLAELLVQVKFDQKCFEQSTPFFL